MGLHVHDKPMNPGETGFDFVRSQPTPKFGDWDSSYALPHGCDNTFLL